MDSMPKLQERLVVDQDRSAGNIMADMQRSYANIQKMRSV